MEEARALLTRLRRIELLEREGAAPQHLLAEVRELLREAEAWSRVEHAGPEAEDAMARCRATLAREEAPLAAR